MTDREVGWWIVGGLVLGVVSSYAATWLWNRGRCRCKGPAFGSPRRGFGADLPPADSDEPPPKPIPQKIQDAINEHISDEPSRQQVREQISLEDEPCSYKNGVLRVGDDDRFSGTPVWYYRGEILQFASGRFSLRYEGTVRRGYQREFATVREWRRHVDEAIARRQEKMAAEIARRRGKVGE